ncbi:MAG: hypothetical protein JWM82_3914 [Myxococcales bacterium]|nr:hypothetical protein [Myxococcales bacterium]
MLGTLVAVLLVVVAGARARDALRLRQQEIVLAKLAEPDAVAYYDVLRRRVRNARILRALSLLALLCLFYAWRRGLVKSLTSS